MMKIYRPFLFRFMVIGSCVFFVFALLAVGIYYNNISIVNSSRVDVGIRYAQFVNVHGRSANDSAEFSSWVCAQDKNVDYERFNRNFEEAFQINHYPLGTGAWLRLKSPANKELEEIINLKIDSLIIKSPPS